MLGDECTGDLSALRDLAEGDIRIKGNWVTFRLAESDLTIQMKVFADDSIYGIGNGRISKLSIYNDAKRHLFTRFYYACETDYERGWARRPQSAEAYDRCRRVVEALGSHLDFECPQENSSPSL